MQEGVEGSGTYVSNLAWHNGLTWEDVSYNNGFDGPVYAIACFQNGTGADDVYIGGNFRQTYDYTVLNTHYSSLRLHCI